MPVRSAVAGHVKCEFEPAPDSQLVECSARLGFPLRLADHGAAWLHLLLDEHRGGEFHSLPPFFNACAQKQRAQMLFNRPRADVQLARDFFIAVPLHQQMQDLLVSGGYLDAI